MLTFKQFLAEVAYNERGLLLRRLLSGTFFFLRGKNQSWQTAFIHHTLGSVRVNIHRQMSPWNFAPPPKLHRPGQELMSELWSVHHLVCDVLVTLRISSTRTTPLFPGNHTSKGPNDKGQCLSRCLSREKELAAFKQCLESGHLFLCYKSFISGFLLCRLRKRGALHRMYEKISHHHLLLDLEEDQHQQYPPHLQNESMNTTYP